MRIRGKYRLNRRSIRKLICALMCAIAVYLTKGASYDPHAASMCEMEIAHLEAIEKTLESDEAYVEVSSVEYNFLKPNYFGFKTSAQYQEIGDSIITGVYEQKYASLVDTLKTLEKTTSIP